MKKGILFRLLVIVLVCAMLFGLMGFTTTEPQDGEDVVQNEEVTEQPTGSQGEEPKGEEPGEKPGEEPGEKPGEEPGDEPQKPELIKISIASGMGGTLALDMAKLPEGAEVEEDGSAVYAAEGTVLNFVATAAKEGVVSSEFVAAYVDDETDKAGPVKVVDGTEADGGYTFSVTTGENPITVSAEFFGIESVEVSNANVWVNASNKDGGKIVTVKTFGAKNVVLSADGDTITATDKGDGKFTARVAAKDYQLDEKGKDFTVKISNNGLEAETKVKVCKIDTVAPEVSFVSKQEKTEGRKTWSYVTWKITETGSGVVNKFKFERMEKGEWVEAGTAQDSYEYNPNTGELTFKVLAIYYNNLAVTFRDVAGNETSRAKSPRSYVEIVGVSKGHVDETVDETVKAWWAGLGAELLFNSDKEDAMVFVGEKSVDVNKKSIETDENNVRQYSANIQETGEYTVMSKDNNASDTAVINYDPTAPVISNAKFDEAYVGDNWLKNFLSGITNGWLFNNGFRFTFDVEENDSGVYAYAYKLVKEGEEAPTEPDIRAAKAGGETNGWTFPINSDAREVVVENTGEFTGYVYLCVWDNAENCSMVRVGVDDNNKEAIITNIATKNDDDTPRDSVDFNPTLTVKATSDGKAYFYKNSKDEDNWVRSVDFTICARKDEAKLPTRADENKAATESSPAETIKYTYRYADEAPSVTATYGDTIETAINVTPANSTEYQYKANIGNSGVNVSYAGNVVFTASYKIIETATTYVEGNGDGTPVDNEVAPVTVTVSIPVNVQNFLNPATVDYKVNENEQVMPAESENGWFNGLGNVLSAVKITGCQNSTAPAFTYYELTKCDLYGKNSEEIVSITGNDKDKAIKSQEGEYDSFDLFEQIKNNGSGIYTLTVWSEDDAGNTCDKVYYTFKYDVDAPTIAANISEETSKEVGYYNPQRTLTVNISDNGFIGNTNKNDEIGRFVVDLSNFASLSGQDSMPELLSDWTFKPYHDDTGGVWEIRYTYGAGSGNGRDGDNYKVKVSCTDNAGNTSSTNEYGELTQNGNNTLDKVYSGESIDDFTIDQTKPVVSVSFDNNNVRNGMYFNAGRTATITVVEHNFYEKGVRMTATVNGEAISGSDWVQNGDVWTKTVTFNPQDAICKFSITVTDKAGNTTTDENKKDVYGNSAAPNKFVIDQINPTLGVTGTNQTPYPDACTPGFTGNDTNISSANGSAEYTVQLTRTVREHKNQDVTNLFANINPNMGADIISVVYANIPDAAENDGIYTLNVSVTDLAGNSSQTSNTFTVNRHGSFYVFNDDLAKLVNDKFVQKADGKYSITEYNASPLVAGSVKIEIYRDGQLEKTIKPTVGAAVLGASGLYEYTYDLPAENFAQDGRYSISVSSEDEAKNMSDNTKLEESILEFTVDSVNPEIVIIKGLEKAIVNAEELEFTVNAVDTYGIKSIQIVVDGEVVKTFVPQEVYDQLKAEGKAMQQYEVMDENLDFTAAYTLYESNSKQSIEIVVTDMAGNSFTTASKDFAPVYDFHDSILVSTSFFARYIHNPVALVGTGIVIAGAVWLVIAKKKKTEEAAA